MILQCVYLGVIFQRYKCYLLEYTQSPTRLPKTVNFKIERAGYAGIYAVFLKGYVVMCCYHDDESICFQIASNPSALFITPVN